MAKIRNFSHIDVKRNPISLLYWAEPRYIYKCPDTVWDGFESGSVPSCSYFRKLAVKRAYRSIEK